MLQLLGFLLCVSGCMGVHSLQFLVLPAYNHWVGIYVCMCIWRCKHATGNALAWCCVLVVRAAVLQLPPQQAHCQGSQLQDLCERHMRGGSCVLVLKLALILVPLNFWHAFLSPCVYNVSETTDTAALVHRCMALPWVLSVFH